MIQRWSAWLAKEGHSECADLPFEDDGQTVRSSLINCVGLVGFQDLQQPCPQMPDWAHLHMTEDELRAHLQTTGLGRCERIVQHIVHWLFHEQQVYTTNKVFTWGLRWHTFERCKLQPPSAVVVIVIDQIALQIHYQEVLAILEDLGMERLHLWLQDHHDDITMGWDVGRRIGSKFGHGDILFDDIEFLYVKPRTPHEGHHKTGVTWVDEAVAGEVGGHHGLSHGENGAPKTHRSGYQSATLRLRVHSRTQG